MVSQWQTVDNAAFQLEEVEDSAGDEEWRFGLPSAVCLPSYFSLLLLLLLLLLLVRAILLLWHLPPWSKHCGCIRARGWRGRNIFDFWWFFDKGGG
jgi:hypothetical protein